MPEAHDNSDVSHEPSPTLPASDDGAASLSANTVFWGLLATQFLGAFNDNYFKQMVLLKCTELADSTKNDL